MANVYARALPMPHQVLPDGESLHMSGNGGKPALILPMAMCNADQADNVELLDNGEWPTSPVPRGAEICG